MTTQPYSPTPTPSNLARQPTHHPNTAIIGGAIGGTLFLLLILAAIFIPLFKQRRSCLDVAFKRHSKATATTPSIRKDSMQEEKIVQHENAEMGVEKGEREEGRYGQREEDKEEEMLGLQEMLRIDFPHPTRYELDAGGFVEGRANWEIKL